jgi:hypothetical protein
VPRLTASLRGRALLTPRGPNSITELLSAQLKRELESARNVFSSTATLFMSSFRVFVVDPTAVRTHPPARAVGPPACCGVTSLRAPTQVDARTARDYAAQNVVDAIKEVERLVLMLSEDDNGASGPTQTAGKVALAHDDATSAVRPGTRVHQRACVCLGCES